MADLKEIAENLIKGKAFQVKELVKKALDEGVSFSFPGFSLKGMREHK